MLLQLERNFQRVLADRTFALPYWDWAVDGQLPLAQQPQAAVWAQDCMGGSRNPVSTGPFVFTPANSSSFRVRIEATANNQLRQSNRGLRRALGSGVPDLPTKAHTADVIVRSPYDAPPWGVTSASFRNRVEGWLNPGAPALHNRVHVWVGGDMAPSTSPNDPVFYCNVNRIWERWLIDHGRTYLPPDSAPADLKGHRLHDQMASLLSAPMRPADVLDLSSLVTYDSLAV
jgi:tyrosinase